MKIFIAGATGVIGRRVVPQLLAAGHQVTAIARSSAAQAALRQMDAGWATASLFDLDALKAATRSHDTIINLATHVPPSSRALFPRAWRETAHIRREGSANLVAAARTAGAARFIQESFAPIYQDGGGEWIDERSPVRAARYNRTTLDAERSAEEFTVGRGTGIALRFAYFYGPDSDFTRDTIRYARKGWAAAFGDPEGYLSSVSHDDAARAVVAALDIESGVYNVVDDEPLRRREYFAALADMLGIPPPKLPPLWLGRLTGSVGETMARSLRISNRKLREASDWTPTFPSVREGYRSVIAQMTRER
jgi:nucleoside-diphosphate-sugar epimerase